MAPRNSRFLVRNGWLKPILDTPHFFLGWSGFAFHGYERNPPPDGRDFPSSVLRCWVARFILGRVGVWFRPLLVSVRSDDGGQFSSGIGKNWLPRNFGVLARIGRAKRRTTRRISFSGGRASSCVGLSQIRRQTAEIYQVKCCDGGW